MTQKLLIIPIIAVLFAVGIHQAYAEEVKLPFDTLYQERICGVQTWTVEATGKSYAEFTCDWIWETTEDINKLVPENFQYLPEKQVEILPLKEAIDAIKEPIIEKPVIQTEQQIKVEGIIDARDAVEDFGANPEKAYLYCYGGTVRESSIYYPDTDTTIEIKRPNDNVPLSTNMQFKYEHLLSEMCKADYTLHNKVYNPTRTMSGEGESYIFVPRANFEGIELWQDTTGLDNPTYAYAEAKMLDLNTQKSILTAEGFQCSIEGKAQGHCIKSESDQVEPTPRSYMSNEGKQLLRNFEAFLQTGITGIPKIDPDAEPDPLNDLKQFINARGITDEQLEQFLKERNQ